MTQVVAHGRWLVQTSQAMEDLGYCLGTILRPGDIVTLDGPLGAGKTTLTRGIGAALHVAEPVTSPTFVIAREHQSRGGSTGLVHVDAYRLGGPDDLDDLDLDLAMGASATVVEWAAVVEAHLPGDRLEIVLATQPDESRLATWRAVGERWVPDLSRVAGCAEPSSPRTSPGRPA